MKQPGHVWTSLFFCDVRLNMVTSRVFSHVLPDPDLSGQFCVAVFLSGQAYFVMVGS